MRGDDFILLLLKAAVIPSRPPTCWPIPITCGASGGRHRPYFYSSRKNNQSHYLRTRSSKNKASCTTLPITPADAARTLRTALQPYRLDWPGQRRNQTTAAALHSNDDDHDNNDSIINLFDRLEPTQVRTGPGNETITTDWYDHRHLGFFADSDQEWTQDRDVWILYDHWAVLKGIVTGTIDLPSISTINT